MNRTSRCCGSAPSPRKVKSKKLTWLLQMIAPPVVGTCSEPRTSNRKRNSRKTTRTMRIDEPVRQVARDPAAGPNRSRRTTSRQLAVYMSAKSSPRELAARLAGLGSRCPAVTATAARTTAARSPRLPVDPALQVGAGAPAQQRRRARRRPAARRRRRRRAGRTWSSRAADHVGGRRRPAGARGGPGRRPARSGRPARRRPGGPRRGRRAAGCRRRASRAAVSTRPRTRPASVTASSTRRATSAVRTSTVGHFSDRRASK